MIKVIDVSAYIYGGMGTDFGSRAVYKGIPTGGLYNLLRMIAMTIKDKTPFALCFDSWTNAQSFVPSYKGGRSANPKIRFQVDLAYQFLKESLPNNVFKINGYEADWLANDIFENYGGNKNDTVIGYTVDFDWAHNIIAKNTYIMPATSQFYHINIDNFEGVVSTEFETIKFNSISFYKVLYGDTSDNIPQVYLGKYATHDIYQAFLFFCKQQGLDNRMKSTALTFINQIKGGLPDECFNDLTNRIEIIYPKPLNQPLTVSYDTVNPEVLTPLLSITGCKSFAKKLKINFIEDMKDLQEDVRQRYLSELGTSSKTHIFEGASENAHKTAFTVDRGGFK